MAFSKGSYIFTISRYATLYVPKGTAEVYRVANVWKDFEDINEKGVFNGITWDSQGILYTANDDESTCYVRNGDPIISDHTNYRHLPTTITIPEVYEGRRVTSIGEGAFWGCDGLTSVTIPTSVTSIGQRAFWCCNGLTSFDIPKGVASIGGLAFYGCSGLTSINIPDGVTSIGEDAFSYCSGLTSVTIPSSVTCIGMRAFSNCSKLTSVTIPSSVTSMGGGAFQGCSKLTSVVVGWGLSLIHI